MEQNGSQVNFCNLKQNILYSKLFSSFIVALLFVGPNLPKEQCQHQSVTHGNDMIAIAGSSQSTALTDLHKLTLQNKQFQWTTMNVQLNTPRSRFVAFLIPA